MKRTITAFALFTILLAGLLAGCGVDTPDSPHVVLTGNEQFKTYVAIGNSLTAGYMDGGLVVDGQLGSFPSLIARQMGYSVGVSSTATFTQPYILRPGVGTTSTGDPAVTAGVLHWTGSTVALLGTTPTASVPALAVMATLPAPYNNLGVPGATTLDVHQALTHANSQAPGNAYFDLILRNPTFGNVTMREQAIHKKPTLMTVWIGANDILGGATGGNPVVGVNITPAPYFAALFDSLLARIQHGVTEVAGLPPVIVAGNIPSITDIPYFVPKALFDGAAGGAIPTVESDVVYVRFPALGYLAGGGPLPLPGEWTLTQAEVDVVNGAVDAYNLQIATICAARGVGLMDAHALLAGVTAGDFAPLTGGHYAFGYVNTAFSLDGVHPNNRGYGLVANAWIDAINAAAGTTLAHVDVAALTWDPTYGTAETRGAAAGTARITPAAASALDRMFR
ncbi:MAG: SGNH/GDSL hydrolase family protein [Candidatus Krumholzibacteriia bacterium]